MQLFVTGASSFVGAHFCALAASRGHKVYGLWRNTALRLQGVTSIRGEMRFSVPPAGTDAVIHLATKVFGPDPRAENRAMMDAVVGWGLPVVYCSSTVVHWARKNAYAEARVEDEERAMKLARWLIVRPCAPYGPRPRGHTPQHKESFHTLARMCRRLPIVPVMGSGSYRRQPVHVDDFNGAILQLMEKGSWNAAYDAGGPEPLTLRAIIRALGGRAVLPIPRPVVRVLGPLAGMPADVVETFDTDDVVDPGPLARASGLPPRPFDAAALREC
jgi:nucleoside-diphosphate-sugar epimerase